MRRLAVVALALCVVVVVGYGLGRGDWLGGLLAGLTLAMAILPNELPAVLTIFLAARRLAHVSQACARTADARARDARLGDRALRRQDRHAHDQPDDGPQAGPARGELRRPASTTGRRCPSSFTSWSSTRCWRASAIPSTRWRRRSRRSASAGSPGPSTSTPAGRWCGSIPCRTGCSRCPTSGDRPDGAEHVIAAKGAHEAIADLCHLDPAASARLAGRRRRWRSRG